MSGPNRTFIISNLIADIFKILTAEMEVGIGVMNTNLTPKQRETARHGLLYTASDIACDVMEGTDPPNNFYLTDEEEALCEKVLDAAHDAAVEEEEE